MQGMRCGDWSKTGRVAWLLRSLASGQGAKWTLIALLWVGLPRVASLLYAQGRTVTTTLTVQVAEAGLLEQQDDNVIVKLRLTPGVAVSLWGDRSCTTPAFESYIITASGIYTIPLNQIKQGQKAAGDDDGSICMQSSDGVLRRSLPVIGRALPTGTMTSASKSAPQLTWSGRVSIPAARFPAAKIPSCCAHTNSLAPR
jgi:hypothetical protein